MCRMLKLIAPVVLVLPASLAGSASAQQLPPVAVYEAMLGAAEQSGWVQFRNYSGRQWVYFTPLQTLHCRLKEIRYSINSDALDLRFDLVPCNAQLPFSLPSDAGVEDIALRLKPGAAQSVTVQVVWEDDRESTVRRYKPCDNVGEQSCAVPAE